MKSRLAAFAALAMIACTALGCESKLSANDPKNKQYIFRHSALSATTGGEPQANSEPTAGVRIVSMPAPK